MPVTIRSNIASITAQRKLAENSSSLSTIFERLSSGQRINRASDDAAGLAIADSLHADVRVFNQGVRNLNDGISLLNIADSAIEGLSSIVIRLTELAEQAANGTYAVRQRKSIDAEAQVLAEEYFRIARSTTFNGRGVFFAEFGDLRLQGGYGNNGGIESGLGGAIGTGTFGPTSYGQDFGVIFRGLAMGDLNADGVLDMVRGGNGGFTAVSLGRGDGAFGSTTTFFMESSGTNAVVLGDLNGDGVLDVVTAGSGGGSGRATVRLGTGSGTFGAATSYTTETAQSFGLALGDLNGDGILDLVTAGDAASDGATVRLGIGNGTFGGATSYTMSAFGTRGIALGDLNGDGILDMASAGDASDGESVVRLGTGNGSFGAAATYLFGSGDTVHAVTLGDLNGDGVLDLVTAADASGTGRMNIKLGLGNGTFGNTVSYFHTTISHAVNLADLNGDGILDLVAAGFSGATVRLGAGNGTFGAAVSYAMLDTENRALALGDVNGDGVLDLATAGYGLAAPTAGSAVRLSKTTSGIAPLLPFNLTSSDDALQARSQFDLALNRLSAQRGTIGAFQTRIGVAVNVLQVSSENFRAAESRVRDAGIADETSELIRLNILRRAASAVLAQANQQPALAIRLLSTT